MRLRLNDPSLVPDLVMFFQRGGLTAAQESDDTVNVFVPHALNEQRDREADSARIMGELRDWLSVNRQARVDVLQGDPPLLGVS